MTAEDFRGTRRTSGWVVFAGTMVAIAAATNLLYSVTLLANDDWIVLTPEAIVRFDTTVAGIILLLFAVFQFFVAAGIFHGDLWARILGIIGASLNAITMMAFMSVYEGWAWVILAVNVLVIYALSVHGDEVAEL